MTPLDYVSGSTIIPKGAFGISPSNVNTFITKPHTWYREQVLGEKQFDKSTATILGTIVHYCAEQYIKTKAVPKSHIFDYLHEVIDPTIETNFSAKDDEAAMAMLLQSKLSSSKNPHIDVAYILEQWKPMGQAVIDYLKVNKPNRSEELICAEIMPGFYASGSADAVMNDTLIDFKTTSDLTPKAYIPMNYKYQLLTYAWIYTKMGVPINRIRIVWITNNQVGRVSETTGKPLKDYPATATAVTEEINSADLDFIESILRLISETVQAARDYPHLTHCLFKDYRLKQ